MLSIAVLFSVATRSAVLAEGRHLMLVLFLVTSRVDPRLCSCNSIVETASLLKFDLCKLHFCY